MKNSLLTRRTILTASAIAVAAAGVLPAGAALAADGPASASASVSAFGHNASPSAVLASTPWETTDALDQNGDHVALTDPAVANFVGWAYYKTDGTFTMYNLDDSPKMHGDWSVSPDGATRTLVAKDAAGSVLFTRVVPITELTKHRFVYRVFPNAADTSVYYDIVHTPTRHLEPGTTPAHPGNGHHYGQDKVHTNNGNGGQGNNGNGGRR